jgi:hypothetical protein
MPSRSGFVRAWLLARHFSRFLRSISWRISLSRASSISSLVDFSLGKRSLFNVTRWVRAPMTQVMKMQMHRLLRFPMDWQELFESLSNLDDRPADVRHICSYHGNETVETFHSLKFGFIISFPMLKDRLKTDFVLIDRVILEGTSKAILRLLALFWNDKTGLSLTGVFKVSDTISFLLSFLFFSTSTSYSWLLIKFAEGIWHSWFHSEWNCLPLRVRPPIFDSSGWTNQSLLFSRSFIQSYLRYRDLPPLRLS